ncbi:MAG: sigma-70 family RNA polymerase sigma factor [Phycisphaerae bacterium]
MRARLVRLAVRLIWNRDDAEEIVQEALTLAVEKKVAATPSFEPWALRTVANLALNWRRRRRIESLADWSSVADGASPDAQSAARERLERVRAALETLPPQQRVAIALRTLEELDYDAIAAVMELSPSAVRTHVHLARRRLLELLGEPEDAT